MKTRIGLLALLLVIILGLSAFLYPKLKESYRMSGPDTAIDIGQQEQNNDEDVKTVPDFLVRDSNGDIVSLSDYFGNPIVLNFWATWCSPCTSELPDFNSAYETYGKNVIFLMVNLTDGERETINSVESFLEENKYAFPVYFDTEYSASTAYGVRSIPMTMFIKADGTLMDYRIGSIDAETLSILIEQLIEK